MCAETYGPLEAWPGLWPWFWGLKRDSGGKWARSGWSTRRRIPGPELWHHEADGSLEPLKPRFKPGSIHHCLGTLDLEIFKSQFPSGNRSSQLPLTEKP